MDKKKVGSVSTFTTNDLMMHDVKLVNLFADLIKVLNMRKHTQKGFVHSFFVMRKIPLCNKLGISF